MRLAIVFLIVYSIVCKPIACDTPIGATDLKEAASSLLKQGYHISAELTKNGRFDTVVKLDHAMNQFQDTLNHALVALESPEYNSDKRKNLLEMAYEDLEKPIILIDGEVLHWMNLPGREYSWDYPEHRRTYYQLTYSDRNMVKYEAWTRNKKKYQLYLELKTFKTRILNYISLLGKKTGEVLRGAKA